MNRSFFSLFIILVFSINTFAQQYQTPDRIFGKGQTDIQLGFGLISTSGIMDNATIKMLPVGIEMNRMFGNNVSIGILHSRSVAESQPIIASDGIEQRLTNHFNQTGLKTAFHVTKIDNADFYGGFMLALNTSRHSVNVGDMEYMKKHMGIRPVNRKFTYTGYVGARYAVGKKWTLFGEAGFGESILTMGVGYRL